MVQRTFAVAVATTLLALSTVSAQAQSNVTISGWLDIGVFKKTGGATSLGTIGRSNFAFSGSEDLGGGLAATFRLSSRFDLDTGALENSDAVRPFFKGESTVGLKGGFGAVRFGRALTPIWEQAWAFDPWYNFDRIASQQWWQFAPDFLTDPTSRDYARLNNGIFYDTPKFGGFHAHVSLGVEKQPTDLKRSLGLSLNYDQGPISLMLGGEQNSQDDTVGFIGAAYSITPAIRVMGSYNEVKLNRSGVIYSAAWTNWAGASYPTNKRSSYNVAATYSAGSNTFKVGYGHDIQGATNFFNYIGSTFNTAGTRYSGPIDMVSLGHVYALSKRTSLFADLAYSKWKFTDDSGRDGAYGWALGMSHSF